MKAKLTKLNQKLLDLAIRKAHYSNNDWVLQLLRGVTAKNMTQAERDLINDYLELPAGTKISI